MNKLVLAVCLISALNFTGKAQMTTTDPAQASQGQAGQKQMTPEQRAKRDADNAEKKLGLSSEQKTKWEAASLERARASEPLLQKMRGSTTPEERQQLKGQMRVIKDKYTSTVAAILTPEQKAKYDQMKNERETRMKEMRHNKSNTSPR